MRILPFALNMASEIFFKFGYEKDTSKVKFSGNQLTLRELKERIIEIKQLRLAHNVDLKVVDAADGIKGTMLIYIYVFLYILLCLPTPEK